VGVGLAGRYLRQRADLGHRRPPGRITSIGRAAEIIGPRRRGAQRIFAGGPLGPSGPLTAGSGLPVDKGCRVGQNPIQETGGGTMDPKLFRESREEIERICQGIDLLIKKKVLRESAEKLQAAQGLLANLSKLAQGEVQKRAVANLDGNINILSESIDKILSKRETGKKGDGNVALKCNWNDKNYRAPCSKEAYEFNIREGRAWCNVPSCKCREYGEEVNLENNPCYESIALKEMYFGAGWDHTGDRQQPRHMHHVREDRMAILTTRLPETEERNRLIIGCLFINRVNDDPGEETKIYGDKDRSIAIPFQEVKIRFWDYYKNPGAEDVIFWGSGLFRYVTNGTVFSILKAIGEQYTNTHRDVHKVSDLIKHYEKLMGR